MQVQKKTNAQLVSELADLRQRLSGVEGSVAEQALLESEPLLRQIVDAVRYVLFVVDHKNYSVLYVNPAYERIWGRTCESLYQEPTSWLDAIFSEDRERVNAALEGQQRTGEFNEEFRITRADGSIRWIYDYVIPILNPKGEVFRLVGIAEDITERKQREEALRHREARLADAQAVAHVGSWEWKILANEEWWSDETYRIFGVRPEDFAPSYENHLSTIHPDDRERVVAAVEAALGENKPVDVDYRIVRPDGTERIVNSGGRVFCDDRGTPVRIVGTCQDITERKRAEEAQRRYESMVSASSDLMAFVDPTYTYRAVNPAYCDAHEKTREEILGHTVAEVLGEKLFETRVKSQLDRCLSGEQMNFVFWWDSQGRGRRHVDATYDPFYKADGSVAGVLVNVRDTTDRRLVDEQIRTSRQHLRDLAARQNAAREEERTLIAREMHDVLGQALTGVRMELHGLIDAPPEDPTVLAARVDAAVSLVDSTIETVRAMSWRIRPAILDDLGLEAAIEWHAEEFTSQSGLAVRLDLDLGERPLDSDRTTTVFRILQEALTNVARHAEASNVEIALTESKGVLVLDVRDDGKGIAKRDVTSATALGLIGMRERAGTFGGRVVIRRTDQGGTQVELTLPLEMKEG